jgi:hypothetical protein
LTHGGDASECDAHARVRAHVAQRRRRQRQQRGAHARRRATVTTVAIVAIVAVVVTYFVCGDAVSFRICVNRVDVSGERAAERRFNDDAARQGRRRERRAGHGLNPTADRLFCCIVVNV